jgi:ribonuclease P protein component
LKAKGFPRQVRITNPVDYQRVLASPCRYFVGKGLVAKVIAAENTQARLGLAISRRHLPSAVDRNAIKRLLREQFRILVSKLYPVDIIFFSYKKITDISWQKENLKQTLPEFFFYLSIMNQHESISSFHNKRLSLIFKSLFWFTMPLFTHLLGICAGSYRALRCRTW